MCCQTNSIQFCCSNNLHKGITIAGIIDVILLTALIAINMALKDYFGHAHYIGYFSLWFVVVIIADLLLIIGTMKRITGLLLVWMIAAMVNIILLFICWIPYLLYGVLIVFAGAICSSENVDCGEKGRGIFAFFIIDAIFVFGLPIYYIYLWIVVKSHRSNLVDSREDTIKQIRPGP